MRNIIILFSVFQNLRRRKPVKPLYQYAVDDKVKDQNHGIYDKEKDKRRLYVHTAGDVRDHKRKQMVHDINPSVSLR